MDLGSKEAIRKRIEDKASMYVHFDYRSCLTDSVLKYITNPEKVKKHGFYPFLHFIIEENKIKKVTGGFSPKNKKRDIMYADHLDSWIYRYYGEQLNTAYNEFVASCGISKISIAYRNCMRGQSNIEFAEEAFAFLIHHAPCYVIIGDFTHFFDYIDHTYLKKQLCQVLKENRLSDDFFKVYQAVTQYSYVEYDAIVKYKGMTRRQLSHEPIILTKDEFRILSRRKRGDKNDEFIIKKNHRPYGIPQGSPLSGVLANIYMVEYDQQIAQQVAKYGGYYRRYSDDFMILLPCKDMSEGQWNLFLNNLKGLFVQKSNRSNKNLVKLSPEKTQKYILTEQRQIQNLSDPEKKNNVINFLGFSYDGHWITVRDKTVARYYRRLYQKIGTIERNGGYINGKRISCRNLYQNYTNKGILKKGKNGKKHGNFIHYAFRAERIFNRRLKDLNHTGILRQRHLRKIRRKLDKIFRRLVVK